MTSKSNESKRPREGEDEDKNPDTKETKPPAKKSKKDAKAKVESTPSTSQSTRTTRKSKASDAGKTSEEKKKIVEFLLGDEALSMVNRVGGEEIEIGKKEFNFLRDPLNPFQSLIAALMLSKPFSHVIATRAINQLFSHSMENPKEVLDFGEKKIYEVLEKAKTLHRGKTASQIILLAETCSTLSSSPTDSSLSSFLSSDDKDVDVNELQSEISKAFKGYGPKTASIFLRRVQTCEGWGEAIYPYADEATLDAAREVALVGETDGAAELAAAIKEGAGKGEIEEERNRFGRSVDVLVYLGLEGKIDEALKRALEG